MTKSLVIFTIILLLFTRYPLFGQDLNLDPNFGNGGKITMEFAKSKDEIRDIVRTNSGGVLYLGSTTFNDSKRFLFQTNSMGNPVVDFGQNGQIKINQHTYWIQRILMDSSNRIITLGILDSLYLNRFSANGQPDPTFGDNGVTKIPLASDLNLGSPLEMIQQPNGKILIAQVLTNQISPIQRRLLLVRLNTDGKRDITFGQGGQVYLNLISQTSSISGCCIGLNSSGKIIVSMAVNNFVSFLQFEHNGTWDTNYGIKKSTTIGVPQHLTIDALNQFWVAGYKNINDKSIFITHCDSLGSAIAAKTLGNAFNYGYSEASNMNMPNMLKITPTGQVTMGLFKEDNTKRGTFCVLRLHNNLSFDSNFGTDGQVELPTLFGSHASAIWLDSNAISVAGMHDYDLMEWTLDYNGNEVGVRQINVENASSYIQHIAVNNDGGPSAIWGAEVPTTRQLFKFKNNGDLDATFGNNGKIELLKEKTQDIYTDFLVNQPDQKKLFVWNQNAFTTISRYGLDGNLDSSFNQTGTRLLLNPWDPNEPIYITDIVFEADGKMTLGGMYNVHPMLIRLNIDGTFDTTFGNNGWARNTSIQKSFFMYDLIRIQDGSYFLAGSSSYFAEIDFVIASWRANGSPNTSFSPNGLREFDRTSNEWGTNIQQLADGNLLLSGSSTPNNKRDLTLLKITLSGTLVNDFGSNGYATISQIGMPNDNLPLMELPSGQLIAISEVQYNPLDSISFLRVVQLDANGNLNTTFGQQGVFDCFIDNAQVYTNEVKLYSDGTLYIAGESKAQNGLYLASIWKVKSNLFVTSTSVPLSTTNHINITPNPAKSSVSIELPANAESISVFDMSGKAFFTSNQLGLLITESVKDWPVGLYIVQVQLQNGSISTSKLSVIR